VEGPAVSFPATHTPSKSLTLHTGALLRVRNPLTRLKPDLFSTAYVWAKARTLQRPDFSPTSQALMVLAASCTASMMAAYVPQRQR
jgi:hypothetical protein